ncbi:hypothetical protein [Streptomyces sodiiphilus]|uniref:hypothetical protein n=1 Tax=Streptomyces sodiiphilus TaxID=226217 RepID=UPI0031CDC119
MFGLIVPGLREMPRDAGRLKLPQYELLRAVVRMKQLPSDAEDRAKKLRSRLYDERPGKRTPALDLSPNAGPLWATVWRSGVWAWHNGIARQLFVLRTNRRMTGSRAWFSDWTKRHTGDRATSGFFSEAQKLAPGGSWAEDAEQVLMRALLADLDAAVKRRLFSPWRARRTRFVILVGPVQGEAETAQQRVADFVRLYRAAVKDLSTKATVLVALVSTAQRDALSVPKADGFAAAKRVLRESAGRQGGNTAEVALDIPDPAQAADRSVEEYLRTKPKIQPKQTIGLVPALMLRLTALLTLLALLAGAAWWAGAPLPVIGKGAPCPDGQFPGSVGHDCVGLSDGGSYFAGMSESFEPLFDAIHETNREVEKLAATGTPVRTVVHFEPYTSRSRHPGAVQGSTLTELRGLALAHRQIWADVAHSDQVVALRVVLANAGPEFVDGVRVAERIVESAREEQIVGVVGLGQSRTSTFRAMEVLDEHAIPMVGTTATADDMTLVSSRYYQLAPSNDRQARAAVSLLRDEPIVERGDGEDPVRARAAVVVRDENDVYSANLAERFAHHFREETGGEVEMLDYRPGYGIHAEVPSDEPAPAQGFARIADATCAYLLNEEPDSVLFWAGREGDLMGFLSQYSRIPACGSRITVLGGDAVANALNATHPVRQYPGLTLYYLAHAVPGQEQLSPLAEAFVHQYEEAYDPDEVSVRLDAGMAALGRDGLYVLREAAHQALSRLGESNFDHTNALTMLADGNVSLQGVTGVLEFEAEGLRIPRDKPVYILRARVDRPEVVLRCGRFATSEVYEVWGREGHPCPRDE